MVMPATRTMATGRHIAAGGRRVTGPACRARPIHGERKLVEPPFGLAGALCRQNAGDLAAEVLAGRGREFRSAQQRRDS